MRSAPLASESAIIELRDGSNPLPQASAAPAPYGHPSTAPIEHRSPWAPAAARVLLVIGDLLAVASVGLVSTVHPLPRLTYLLCLVSWLAVTGCHRIPVPPLWLESMPRVLRHLSLPSLGFLLLSMSGGDISAAARLVVMAILAIQLGRVLSLLLIRTARRAGAMRSGTVIIGGGAVGARIARTLSDHPEYGLDVQGYVDATPNDRASSPYLGCVQELGAILTAVGAKTVIVTFVPEADSHMVELLRWTASRRIDVLVVPRLFDVAVHAGSRSDDHIWGVPVMSMGSGPQGTIRWAGKRAFDVVVSCLGLLALSPLLAAIAVAVRRSSPGPVLFRQTRIGQYGRPFELLKFRSMAVNGDSDTRWNVSGDARVTRIGRLMRKYSLDELPQLINVIRGEMSLIGPRPERPKFVDEFGRAIPSYSARHRVPVGVTGWAQVNGLRGDTSIEERARFDNAYVEQWSMWRDITILLRTVIAIFRHPG